MNEKTDELLLKVNEVLRGLTDRITPNVILSIALLNGFVVGFATTGYLGEASISIKSLNFALIVWQFVVICVFSAKYITLTIIYLNKFFLMAVVGFGGQWQIFGMYAEEYDSVMLLNIQPIFQNGFGTFIFAYFCLMAIKHGFSGNQKAQNTTKQYQLEEDND